MRRVLLLAVAALACAQARGARRSPDFDAQVGAIHRAVVLECQLKAFEVSAGNSVAEKPEWTAAARANTARAVASRFAARGIELKPLETSAQQADEVDELRALANAVASGVRQATYAETFPEKMRRFDYSLGPLDSLLARQGADALVLVWGTSYSPTVGNVALSVLTGSGVPRQAHLTIGVVDRCGALIWFDESRIGGSDLTSETAANSLTDTLLADFR